MSMSKSGIGTHTIEAHKFPDGKKYTGGWKNSQPHGQGEMIYPNGDVYIGTFAEGSREGTGVLLFADGRCYEGEWRKGLAEGKGVLTYAVDGRVVAELGGCSYNANDKIDGVFRANKRHGPCKYTFFNGETFECTFVDGRCPEFEARQAAVRAAPDHASARDRAPKYVPNCGHGTFKFPDGGEYTGEWKNSQPHGQGEMKYPNGDVYEGTFCDGLRDGTGVLTWCDGTLYEGGWSANDMEGTGVWKWLDGSTYEGGICNCLIHGKGVLVFAVDGRSPDELGGFSFNAHDKIDGVFRANKRHGPCKYTFFNGETFECTFVDGRCPEFEARQAAVRAAPDHASARGRAEFDIKAVAEARAAIEVSMPNTSPRKL